MVEALEVVLQPAPMVALEAPVQEACSSVEALASSALQEEKMVVEECCLAAGAYSLVAAARFLSWVALWHLEEGVEAAEIVMELTEPTGAEEEDSRAASALELRVAAE